MYVCVLGVFCFFQTLHIRGCVPLTDAGVSLAPTLTLTSPSDLQLAASDTVDARISDPAFNYMSDSHLRRHCVLAAARLRNTISVRGCADGHHLEGHLLTLPKGCPLRKDAGRTDQCALRVSKPGPLNQLLCY